MIDSTGYKCCKAPCWLALTSDLQDVDPRKKIFDTNTLPERPRPAPKLYVAPGWAAKLPELLLYGLSERTIAKVVGVARSTLHRHLCKMRQAKVIPESGPHHQTFHDTNFVLCLNKSEPATVSAAAGSGEGRDLVGTDTPIAM